MLDECAPIETSPLTLREVDRHEIKNPDEVLIRIEACGVCHSQLHGIEGDWQHLGIPPVLPTVPGHEVVGTIAEAGPGVTKFKVGDRAGITPLLSACGDCIYCAGGREYLCESAEITGESTRGGYAEYITVSERFATRVPDEMPPEYAAPLFCAGITAYKAVKAAEPYRGMKLGIFGIGGVGHMAVQFARLEGCDIVAVSRSGRHLGVARRLGAAGTAEFSGSVDAFVAGLQKSHGLLDAALVFAPSDAATEAAVRAVKKGGTVVVATVGRDPPFLAFEEKTVRGTLIGSTRDMEEVIRLCSGGGIEVVSEAFPLERANEVLKRLKDSEIEARAVLVP